MPPWSPARRVAFRFSCVYFTLVILPFPAWMFPATEPLASLYMRLVWRWPVAATARLLHLSPVDARQLGGGDSAAGWALEAALVAVSLLATLAWTALDRRRHHPRLWPALRVLVRYYLAAVMLGFALAKLGRTQFPPLSPSRLESPFGELSPMGLLWRFMSYSAVYNDFGGLMELAGALLLLWRRTTTVGALVLVAVLTNVVLLDLCFDVNVKINAANDLLMALFLTLPDAGRLVELLLLRRAVAAPPPIEPYFSSPRARRLALLAKLLAVGVLLVHETEDELAVRARHAAPVAPSPLDGRWAAASPAPWERLVVSGEAGRRLATVRDRDDHMHRFTVAGEVASGRLTFIGDDGAQLALTVAMPDGDTLRLDGVVDGAPLHQELRRRPARGYPLLDRGLHWVNERSFNR